MSDKRDQVSLQNRPRLRRAPSLSTNLLTAFSKSAKRDVSTSVTVSSPGNSLIRLWLKCPWEDYTESASPASAPSLALRRGPYFLKATVQRLTNSGDVKLLEMLEKLSRIRHPNVAMIHELYFYEKTMFVVSEYLELSIGELDVQCYPFEEWEMATIFMEV